MARRRTAGGSSPTALPKRARTLKKPARWGVTQLTPGACMTCMAMSGSGVRIGMGITIKAQLGIPKVVVMGSTASCVGVPGTTSPEAAGLAIAAGTRLSASTSAAAVFGCFCPWTSFDIFLLLYLCLYSIFDFSRRTGWWVQNRAARVATGARVARGLVAGLPCGGPSGFASQLPVGRPIPARFPAT